MDNLDKIRKYLEKEGITFLVRDDYFIIPWKIGDLKFHITLNFRPNTKWVLEKAVQEAMQH